MSLLLRCTFRAKLFALLVLLCLGSMPALAQTGVLRGTVLTEGGLPLQGAAVVATPLGQDRAPLGTASDGDGEFVLRRVEPATYQLRISFIGYTPFETQVVVAGNETVRRRIVLREDTTLVGELTVEAERASGAAETIAGLQTVTAADVELVPAPGAAGDLASYLQTMPSVTSVGDRGGQLFVRGGAPGQNLVQLDGMRIYRPFHVLGFYSSFPSTIIDQADIYTAAYPAAYGERLSSVLDIKARRGNKRQFGGEVTAAPFLSAVRLEGPIVPERVSFLVSVRESLVERLLPKFADQNFPYRFGDRFAKLDADLGQVGLSVTGINTYDTGEIAGTQRDLFGNPVGNSRADSSQLHWTNTAIGAQAFIAPASLPARVDLNASYSLSDSEFGNVENPERSTRQETYEAKIGTKVFLSTQTLLGVGAFAEQTTLSYSLQSLFTGDRVANTAREADYTVFGGFVDLSLPLGRSVRVEGGARLVRYQTAEKTVVEPRLKAFWSPEDVPYLREVSLGAGYYHQGVLTLRDERDVGNPFLVYVPVGPEDPIPSALHAVIGFRADDGPQLKVSSEAFVKYFPDLLVPQVQTLLVPSVALERASGAGYGFDVRVETTQRVTEEMSLYLFGGYALTKVQYETEAGESFAPAHDRRHQLQSIARLSVGEFELSAIFRYGSGLPFTPSLGIDQFLVLTSETDFLNDPGEARVLYGDRGSRRLPAYHQLDLWAARGGDARALHVHDPGRRGQRL